MGSFNLIPLRFLSLVAHLVALVTLFWSREQYVKSCLPATYGENEIVYKINEFTLGISIGLVLLAFELIGFISGTSMFLPSQALISIAAHFSAVSSLFYLILDVWDCDIYWWIFGVCSVLPAITEVSIMIGVFGLKTF